MNREPEEESSGALIAFVQFFVSFIIAPGCLIFMGTVFVDICVNTPHPLFGINFWVMVIFPGLSFMASCYMLISYWMNEEGWTQLRKNVMFANIPMCAFFALLLMGQSESHQAGLSCQAQGFLNQVFYLQMNMWHTMTVVTLYRLCESGDASGGRLVTHLCCWGLPVILTTIMVLVSPDNFNTSVWDPELRGIGWCGVRQEFRVIKAIFVNSPQLFTVSFYAQYYYYIHHGHIDPEEGGDVTGALGTTKISTSKNIGALGQAELMRKTAMDNAATSLRLYMTIYMMSFLTNTAIGLLTDNMSTGLSSDGILLMQAALVTPTGFFISLVYMRTAKPLFTCYMDAWINFRSSGNEDKDEFWKAKRARKAERRQKLEAEAEELRLVKRGRSKGDVLTLVTTGVWNFINTILMFVVGIWVWTPMEFLGEQTSSRPRVLFGLIVWGAATVFPFYWFSLERVRTSDCLMHWAIENAELGGAIADDNSCVWLFRHGAEIFFLFVVFCSALAVWNNRDNHALLMIEGPVRKKGIFNSIDMGFRLNSCRNSMSMFTLTLEFYQTWGLTWSASQMKTRYSDEEVPDWMNQVRKVLGCL